MARRKTKSPKEPLSRERIELAAFDLIEEEGLEAASTRKLAAKLGCEAMSIYHYFPSKGHLMDALMDRVVAEELTVVSPGAAPWREQVEQGAREWRTLALRRPNFFPFFALHRFNTPKALHWLNGMLALYGSLGLDEETAVRLFRVTGYYLDGSLLDESVGYSRGPSTVEPATDAVMAEHYPAVVAAGRWFVPSEREATFESGLRVVLDAIEREIAEANTRNRRRSRKQG